MKNLTHGYVNTQIMNYLDLIGYSNFHQDLNDDSVTYEVKYLTSDGRYKITTQFEINGSMIKKDSEFHGVNQRTKEEDQLTIIRVSTPNTLLLQDLFDDWYSKYEDWKDQPDDRPNIMNDYKNHM